MSNSDQNDHWPILLNISAEMFHLSDLQSVIIWERRMSQCQSQGLWTYLFVIPLTGFDVVLSGLPRRNAHCVKHCRQTSF